MKLAGLLASRRNQHGSCSTVFGSQCRRASLMKLKGEVEVDETFIGGIGAEHAQG